MVRQERSPIRCLGRTSKCRRRGASGPARSPARAALRSSRRRTPRPPAQTPGPRRYPGGAAVALLATILGVGRQGAEGLRAASGSAMSRFPSAPIWRRGRASAPAPMRARASARAAHGRAPCGSRRPGAPPPPQSRHVRRRSAAAPRDTASCSVPIRSCPPPRPGRSGAHLRRGAEARVRRAASQSLSRQTWPHGQRRAAPTRDRHRLR